MSVPSKCNGFMTSCIIVRKIMTGGDRAQRAEGEQQDQPEITKLWYVLIARSPAIGIANRPCQHRLAAVLATV